MGSSLAYQRTTLTQAFDKVLRSLPIGQSTEDTSRQLMVEVVRHGWHPAIDLGSDEDRMVGDLPQNLPQMFWSRTLGLIVHDPLPGTVHDDYILVDLTAIDTLDALPADVRELHAA